MAEARIWLARSDASLSLSYNLRPTCMGLSREENQVNKLAYENAMDTVAVRR